MPTIRLTEHLTDGWGQPMIWAGTELDAPRELEHYWLAIPPAGRPNHGPLYVPKAMAEEISEEEPCT